MLDVGYWISNISICTWCKQQYENAPVSISEYRAATRTAAPNYGLPCLGLLLIGIFNQNVMQD